LLLLLIDIRKREEKKRRRAREKASWGKPREAGRRNCRGRKHRGEVGNGGGARCRWVVVVRRDTVWWNGGDEGHDREKKEGCYGARIPWYAAARRASRAGSRGRLLD